MINPAQKNMYPTFANPAGIGSCMGYESLQPQLPPPDIEYPWPSTEQLVTPQHPELEPKPLSPWAGVE